MEHRAVRMVIGVALLAGTLVLAGRPAPGSRAEAVAASGHPLFLTPTWGWLSSPQGWRLDPLRRTMWQHHWGIDIAADVGTPVLASAPGVVVFTGWYAGYGRTVYLDHGSGWATLYGHLSGTRVLVGQWVERGEEIGAVGTSGRSTGPHLHFEIRRHNTPLDPLRFLRR
ncbi:MAG: M23 family metallopeptidase [Armatimonadota bacterium]|nr:M23 family metallopeptidase [Armatimonadota bacterium]MDR7452303.1 M23 family metallopeptidase [Armatimonadota bacterium]MDR7467806.1 M23 family metallopeptidase [Armatimonadota bacterium]MDR7494608.1 M23 family metallopeptidase [Armatimonadota bacterium]MDR7499668.1 M23 family metallopeptidase [Armatimonadota bacterium]